MENYEEIDKFITKCCEFAKKKYEKYEHKYISKMYYLDGTPPDLYIYVKEKNEQGLFVRYRPALANINKKNLLDYYILDEDEFKEKYKENLDDGYKVSVFRYACTLDDVVYVGQVINSFERFKRLLDFFFEKEYEKEVEVKVERCDGRVIFEFINKKI